MKIAFKYKPLVLYQSEELRVSFKIWGLHKFILALIGFLFFSFPGILGGFLIGSFLDLDIEKKEHPPNPADLGISFMMLAISVMRAGGNVSTVERIYAHRYMRNYFGFNYMETRANLFLDLEKQTFQIEAVCDQLNYHLDNTTKIHLVHFLFGTALADGVIRESEFSLINKIGGLLGLTAPQIKSIRMMHLEKKEDVYSIFKVPVDAPFEMIRKAYHLLAKKLHPDKVTHLGDDEVKLANEKFQQLQAAYERIKLERGVT